MRYLILVLFILPTQAWAQSKTGEATTKASCSAANTGTITTLTINCSGMSKEQAGDMVRLMNKILSREIDPKLVYNQLNKIQSSLSSIGDTINPLANAAPRDLSLLEDSQRLSLACSTFLQGWNFDATQRYMALLAPRPAPLSSPVAAAPVDWGEITIEVNRKRVKQFKTTLAEKVSAITSSAIKLIPEPNAGVAGQVMTQAEVSEQAAHSHYDRQSEEIARMHYKVDFDQVVGVTTEIYDAYNDPEIVPSPDPKMLRTLKSLRQELMSFSQDWQASYTKAAYPNGVERVSTTGGNPAAETLNVVNSERSAKYEQQLGPQLEEWRKTIVARDPALRSSLSYGTVSSQIETGRVCSDILTLSALFRMKLIHDLHKH
jgi:hypothetical protein